MEKRGNTLILFSSFFWLITAHRIYAFIMCSTELKITSLKLKSAILSSASACACHVTLIGLGCPFPPFSSTFYCTEKMPVRYLNGLSASRNKVKNVIFYISQVREFSFWVGQLGWAVCQKGPT